MARLDEPKSTDERTAFERSRDTKSSFAADLLAFLAQNKKWWLLPIVIVMVGLGALAALGGTAAAPFIYTLF
jgi:hypothetical protein